MFPKWFGIMLLCHGNCFSFFSSPAVLERATCPYLILPHLVTGKGLRSAQTAKWASQRYPRGFLNWNGGKRSSPIHIVEHLDLEACQHWQVCFLLSDVHLSEVGYGRYAEKGTDNTHTHTHTHTHSQCCVNSWFLLFERHGLTLHGFVYLIFSLVTRNTLAWFQMTTLFCETCFIELLSLASFKINKSALMLDSSFFFSYILPFAFLTASPQLVPFFHLWFSQLISSSLFPGLTFFPFPLSLSNPFFLSFFTAQMATVLPS
jgi:hypothetical protein